MSDQAQFPQRAGWLRAERERVWHLARVYHWIATVTGMDFPHDCPSETEAADAKRRATSMLEGFL